MHSSSNILTCGVVTRHINSTHELCGQPAAFRYSGLVPLKVTGPAGDTIAARLKARIIIDECMEHARETFIAMEPALRDHTAVMRCLVQTKLTIRCNACHSLFRFEPLRPTVHKQPGRFCPNCGAASTSTTFDPTLDYWELVAQSFPPEWELPVSLIQTIYSHWLKDRTATAEFVNYITSIYQTLEESTTVLDK